MNEPLKIDNLTLRAATVAFGAWSAVVLWGVNEMTRQMKAIHEETTITADKFQRFELVTLERLTALEQYNHLQDAKRDRIEADLAEHLKTAEAKRK
jgi:hypothetical protein